MTGSPPSLSDTDRHLLAALFDPASDLLATAAPLGLDLLDLARWLAQPRIQAQVERIQSLRAVQHGIWADQVRQEAAEALREAMPEAMPEAMKESPGHAHGMEPDARARVNEPNAQARVTEPDAQATIAPPGFEIRAPKSPPTSPVPPTLSSPLFAQALAMLRALGYDTTEDELTDDELDSLEDARLDAELDEELDAELDEFAADLTEADIDEAIALAEQLLAEPHDTS